MSTPVLTVEHLTKRFDNQDAVNDINLSVHEGEIVAVKGQTGMGKTTLLKLIAGMIAPTAGIIKIQDGVVTPQNRDTFKKIGFVSREEGLYNRLTVKQYLTVVDFSGQLVFLAGSIIVTLELLIVVYRRMGL